MRFNRAIGAGISDTSQHKASIQLGFI